MRRLCLAIALVLCLASTSSGQSHDHSHASTLREHFQHLYTFGDCGAPLCLAVEAGHGQHFIPTFTQGQQSLLAFIDGAIASSLGNIPVTAAASGVRFTFDGGVPVATTLSPGPFFAERSLTLGAGRALIGANLNGIAFDNLRGQKLDALTLRFAHQDVAPTGVMGDPVFENDYIEVTTRLDLDLLVTSFYGAFGLADRLDVQVVVPVVRTSLSGTSVARVHAFLGTSPHFFGTPEARSDTAVSSVSASATGIGDIAVRTKVNLRQTDELGMAALLDLRLPTGKAEDFLGSGATSVRALGIISAQYGAFAPHINAGVALRSGDAGSHSFLAAIGFDQLLNDRAALAIELISDLQLGESKLALPGPVTYTSPNVRSLRLSDIPDQPDNLIDLALGMKVQAPGNVRAIGNLLLPISEGGVRPRMLWTVGLQRNF